LVHWRYLLAHWYYTSAEEHYKNTADNKLPGAVWASLVPTVIALAVYFCIADCVLILQCLYYNYKNRKEAEDNKTASGSAVENGHVEEDHETDEESPLLSRTESASSGNVSLPGSVRRKSSAASRRRADSLAKVVEEDEEDESSLRATMKNLGSVLLICAIGTAAWAICWKTGIWKPAPEPTMGAAAGEKEHGAPFGAEILGYASAAAYLGARIPQIVKNWREKSCEGLSLLFFLLSLLGNCTYGIGVSFNHPYQEGNVLTVSLDSMPQLGPAIYHDQPALVDREFRNDI